VTSRFSPAEYSAVQDYLFSLKAKGAKYGLDRMRLFSSKLGNPESSCPCIHVAGTNGKGSVASMLESILRTAGYKTGLYTSPHLVRLGERVQVNRTLLKEEEIIAFVNELAPVAKKIFLEGGSDDEPSFFEFMTAMAFLQFQRKKTDINIIEVGLGGKLDATNIVQPEISVITSIGLDHCEVLGDTLEKIAAEKAGIIKPGKPVVIGRMPIEAENVIRDIAKRSGSKLISVREVYGEDITHYPVTRLAGDYQRWNAATATLVCQLLDSRWKITQPIIQEGLDHVDWSGRWEKITLAGRPLILDASHNPEGASVLESNLSELMTHVKQSPVIVTGSLGLARASALLTTVSRYAKDIYLVVPNQSRACTYEQLEALIPPSFKGKIYRSTVEALFPDPKTCTAGKPEDLVIVTGSIYLLGEVMARIQPERGQQEGRLQDF
jgi:dihydrofolate synthase / folylpolyglutamate synthase